MRLAAIGRFAAKHQDLLLAAALAALALVEVWAAETLTVGERLLSTPLAAGIPNPARHGGHR